MNYIIRYYFDQDFYVSRIVEGNADKEVVLLNYTNGEKIKFTGSQGVVHIINMDHVKYVNIKDYNGPAPVQG